MQGAHKLTSFYNKKNDEKHDARPKKDKKLKS
jgi:hypothetical protein